ncbi:hypothetical protein Tco_0428435 [Tanacetum coccineum]
MADKTANVESVPTHSNDPLLSGEDRLKLNELMELCTSLSQRVLAIETTKTAQAKEIASLKKRVKKLEGKRKLKPSGMKRLFKIGRSAQVVSSKDECLEVTLVGETQGRNDEEMFDTGILDGEEVFAEQDVVEKRVSTAEVATNTAKPKAVTRPKVRGVVVQEPSEFTTTTSQLPQVKDKGKAKMVEPGKPLKKKDQIMHDQELVKGSETRTEGSSKRAGKELESENLKKQKLGENIEAEVDDEAEMKKHMEIVHDDEVAIDAIPLSTKPPIILTLKRPEEAYERVLWGDLKVMFKPDVESEVWRNLQGHKVTVWKLFSSSGVHFVMFQNLNIIMLVEKKYLLTPATITEMLNKKLQADH